MRSFLILFLFFRSRNSKRLHESRQHKNILAKAAFEFWSKINTQYNICFSSDHLSRTLCHSLWANCTHLTLGYLFARKVDEGHLNGLALDAVHPAVAHGAAHHQREARPPHRLRALVPGQGLVQDLNKQSTNLEIKTQPTLSFDQLIISYCTLALSAAMLCLLHRIVLLVKIK